MIRLSTFTRDPYAMATDRDLLRHALATLAYRSEKALRDPPADFGAFRAGPSTRTPSEIVGHMADLMEWGLSIAEGSQRWSETKSDSLAEQTDRYFNGLAALDAFLASEAELSEPVGKLFQGPVADALSHTGQIAMLRRLADAPVMGENYHKAQIETGRVERDQPAAVYEFE